MTKAEMAFLERCFASEIDSALGTHGLPPIVQSKSKIALKLEQDGMIKRASHTLGGRFPVTIEGWILTDLGHMTYCLSCPDPNEVQESR